MPSLFKPQIITYQTPDKRKCKKDTPGAKKVVSKAKKWYGQFKDADGRIHRVPLSTDKAAARQMLNERVRQLALGEAGLIDKFAEHRRRPLAEHLDDYRRHLAAKGDTDRHVQQTCDRIQILADACGFKWIGDINAEVLFEQLATWRRHGRAEPGRRKTMSIETANHYLRAFKAFTAWLFKSQRIGHDPLHHLSTLNPEPDRRHVRRSLSTQEFVHLVEVTQVNPAVVCGLTGMDRGMLYRLAAYTGWRASELASLTPESIDVEEQAATAAAAYTKHRKRDELPLHSALVDQMQSWLATRPKGKPLWPGTWAQNRHGAEMLRADLKAAGIPYKDRAGRVFDFHALRGQFVTMLAMAGVALVRAQKLARHSTPNLTANNYTRLQLADLRLDVEKLPPPPEVKAGDDRFVLGLAQTAARGVQDGTVGVSENEAREEDQGEGGCRPKPLNQRRLVADSQPGTSAVTEVPKVGLEPTRVLPHRILSPARLPFRHFGDTVR